MLIGTPLYAAGIERGDRLVSLAGRPTVTEADVQAVLASRKPGDQIPAVVVSRDGRRETSITLAEDPAVEVVTFEQAGLELTDAARTFREAWMRSRVAAR